MRKIKNKESNTEHRLFLFLFLLFTPPSHILVGQPPLRNPRRKPPDECQKALTTSAIYSAQLSLILRSVEAYSVFFVSSSLAFCLPLCLSLCVG